MAVFYCCCVYARISPDRQRQPKEKLAVGSYQLAVKRKTIAYATNPAVF